MIYPEFVITNVRPDPQNGFAYIQFTGEINGENVVFDPFVSGHIEWFEAQKYIGKAVRFSGWRHDCGAYLINEVLGVA